MNTEITRRRFLHTGTAGLTIAWTLAPDLLCLSGDARADQPLVPNVWLTIVPDGTITIVSPASELGQGSSTTLPAVMADELDADWSKAKIVTPPNWDETKYGNPGWGNNFNTTSSLATRGYFRSMRIAGAQARRVLLEAAAAKWGVPVTELTTEPSLVIHKSSNRRLSYGDIAAFARAPAELPTIEDKDLESTSGIQVHWQGRAAPRCAAQDHWRSTIWHRRPGTGNVFAAVLHSPYEGGKPELVDDAAARQMQGISEVVRLPEAVAVVGTSVEATQAAKNRLRVTWSAAPAAQLDSEHALDEFGAIARNKDHHGAAYRPVGDAPAAIQNAHTVFRSEVYRTRYVYHAQLEPLNATAAVSRDGKSAEIWCGTQSPSLLLNDVARALETERSKVSFHQHFVGGGYGRRGGPQDVAVEAVRISEQLESRSR